MTIIEEPTNADWAGAIALRVSDEWDGKSHFPNEAEKIRKALEIYFIQNANKCQELIGTGIIEENYFEDLD